MRAALLRIAAGLRHFITPLLLLLMCAALAWLSQRHEVLIDWTDSRRHSLSAASQSVLDQLQAPLLMTPYAREDSALRGRMQLLLQRYQRYRPEIEIRPFVNPDSVPQQVREQGLNNGDVILEYQGRSERLSELSEQSLSNRLQSLLRERQDWLAVLAGHGERRADGQANHDIARFSERLKERGYRIQPLNLAEVKAVPGNSRLLIIATPQVDLLPAEVRIIREYLASGGNLLWLLDPGGLRGLEPLAEEFGLSQYPGTLVDPATLAYNIQQATVVIASQYPSHPLSEDFRLLTLFPETAALRVEAAEQGWQHQEVLLSNQQAWSEHGPITGEVMFDDGVDAAGPLAFAHSFTRTHADGEQQRVLVVGDGDFLANAWLGNSGNLDLGLRMIHWLTRNDSQISIPARTAADRQLHIDRRLLMMLAVTFLVGLPALLLLSGLLIWWRRRNA